MNKLVSQKIRLIPSLPANARCIRPEFRPSTSELRSPSVSTKDHLPFGRDSPFQTILDTSLQVQRTHLEDPPGQAISLILRDVDDRDRLCGKADVVLPLSQIASGTCQDWVDGWLHNGERHEHRHQA